MGMTQQPHRFYIRAHNSIDRIVKGDMLLIEEDAPREAGAIQLTLPGLVLRRNEEITPEHCVIGSVVKVIIEY